MRFFVLGTSGIIKKLFKLLREKLLLFLPFLVIAFSFVFIGTGVRDLLQQNANEALILASELTAEMGPDFNEPSKEYAVMIERFVFHMENRNFSPIVRILFPGFSSKERLKPTIEALKMASNQNEAREAIIVAGDEIIKFIMDSKKFAPGPDILPTSEKLPESLLNDLQNALDDSSELVVKLKEKPSLENAMETCVANRRTILLLFLARTGYHDRSRIELFLGDVQMSRECFRSMAVGESDKANKNWLYHYAESELRRVEILDAILADEMNRATELLWNAIEQIFNEKYALVSSNLGKYDFNLSMPVVSPNAKIPDGSCVKAPKIEVVAECGIPLKDDALCAKIGKLRYHGDVLPVVPRENIEVKSELSGRRLIAMLDTKSLIDTQYKSTPHGIYRVEFEVFDPNKLRNASSEIEFNYIYKEDFKELDKVLVIDSKNFKNIEGIDGGLEIRNWSKSGTFVSAKLKQEFDFETNFSICGYFTMEFENPRDPSRFDICICDRWGEQLSVVFADGGLNVFSIMMRGEKRENSGVSVRSDTTTIGWTIGDKKIKNYFKIKIWQDGRQSRCSLYVQRNSPDFRDVLPVHERIIDTSVFGGKGTRIMLKLWKAGILRLYNFQVAEVPVK